MKRLWILPVLASLLLGGCLPFGSVIVSSSSSPEGPLPPVEETTLPQPVAETPTESAEPTAATGKMIAYLGADGNIWQMDMESGSARQITTDAATYSSSKTPVVQYNNPQWSSDGRYLAFTRDVGQPISEGYDFSYALMVFDMENGESRAVVDDAQTVGFGWMPGEHTLAFALAPDPNYFVTRGGVNGNLARGIYAVDVDRGERTELVRAEAGYTLVNPQWSPNGRFISFEEILYMEGRGLFGYYDVQAGQYVRWDKVVGGIAWSPDGSQLLLDTLSYAPSYTERIFEIQRDQSGERQLTQASPDGYDAFPVFSPDGKQMAYLFTQGRDEQQTVHVMVQSLEDGSGARDLAVFPNVYSLTWTPDGQYLLFGAGNYPDVQVRLLRVHDGWQQTLADGWQAVMRP